MELPYTNVHVFYMETCHAAQKGEIFEITSERDRRETTGNGAELKTAASALQLRHSPTQMWDPVK